VVTTLRSKRHIQFINKNTFFFSWCSHRNEGVALYCLVRYNNILIVTSISHIHHWSVWITKRQERNWTTEIVFSAPDLRFVELIKLFTWTSGYPWLYAQCTASDFSVLFAGPVGYWLHFAHLANDPQGMYKASFKISRIWHTTPTSHWLPSMYKQVWVITQLNNVKK
jgi:hypothetical protein